MKNIFLMLLVFIVSGALWADTRDAQRQQLSSDDGNMVFASVMPSFEKPRFSRVNNGLKRVTFETNESSTRATPTVEKRSLPRKEATKQTAQLVFRDGSIRVIGDIAAGSAVAIYTGSGKFITEIPIESVQSLSPVELPVGVVLWKIVNEGKRISSGIFEVR